MVLIISGIGKVNSALAVSHLVHKFDIDIFVNLGAAGASTERFAVGDILQIKRCVEFDRPNLLKKGYRFINPDQMDGIDSTTLATQDVAVTDVEERNRVSSVAHLVDMEGAAFLEACKRYGKKAYIFKVVTDTPAHTEDRDIIANVKLTRDKLYTFFIGKIVDKFMQISR